MATRAQLDQLVSFYARGNKAEFARMLGITKQSLNTWYKHEHIDITKVFYACQGVSPEWLITGNGEMLTQHRLPVLSPEDTLIPIIHEDKLQSGIWNESESFIVTRKCSCIYDFITRIPNENLEYYIHPHSYLGCSEIKVQELKKDFLYIIRTRQQRTFFVQYTGNDQNSAKKLYKFTTRREDKKTEIKLTLPLEDIVQCAQIKVHLVND